MSFSFGPRKVDSVVQELVRTTNLSDPTYIRGTNVLVRGMKDAGIWDKMTIVYPFIGDTEYFRKWNLKDLRDADSAYRLDFSEGTWQHNPDGSKRTVGYANTFLNALTIPQFDHHVSFYSPSGSATGLYEPVGVYTFPSRNYSFVKNNQTMTYFMGDNGAGASGLTDNTVKGFWCGNRYNSGSIQLVTPSGNIIAGTSGSNTIPNLELWLGGLNNDGNILSNPTPYPFSFFSVGAGLTTQELTDFHTIVTDFQTFLGRQV